MIEWSKDLRTIGKDIRGMRGGLTRWLAKYGAETKEEKLEARCYQAMTDLLTALARRNQILVNIHQARASEPE